ncbi:HCL365Cp [Eremothecium sinecaudum]|uniref:HCL365Cp n=1 Tax=Eremothecium sinecaudum TaxID=45286 RepID=A0A120K1X0_9SACH|nr:HCL365Cp [Eremothecium sinecaudum]AMD19786.1 HCL365Cp [Eremothecium sinecaudum]
MKIHSISDFFRPPSQITVVTQPRAGLVTSGSTISNTMDADVTNSTTSGGRKRKVSRACIFCRRSHMICDEQKPCKRCIKRNIAHLCCDQNIASSNSVSSQGSSAPDISKQEQQIPPMQDNLASGLQEPWSTTNNKISKIVPQNLTFVSEHVGSEFSSLNGFLTMLEDPMLMEQTPPPPNPTDVNLNGNDTQPKAPLPSFSISSASSQADLGMRMDRQQGAQFNHWQQPTAKENFFLTAADPSTDVEPEDRLKLVINAKLEAGLLKPYNYSMGYARLQNYMDKYMNQSSRQRILKPLSTIRPAFRAIARSLKDVDLVLVEESFERMLLSYDRVFTSMSMPACLWRRTGEIYRGNKEFASLVDCTVDDLRDGRMAIYELMTEESAVNLWEKYGAIAFDKGQKAVLTSCKLRTKDGRKRRACCFSFTIRRDRYNIPICIVGNFIPIS